MINDSLACSRNRETGSCFRYNRIRNIELMARQSRQPSGTGIFFKGLRLEYV